MLYVTQTLCILWLFVQKNIIGPDDVGFKFGFQKPMGNAEIHTNGLFN